MYKPTTVYVFCIWNQKTFHWQRQKTEKAANHLKKETISCFPFSDCKVWRLEEISHILVDDVEQITLHSAAWTWASRSWSCRAAARSCPSWNLRPTASANTTPTRTCEPPTTRRRATASSRTFVSGLSDHSVSHCQNTDERSPPSFLSLHHCVCRIKTFTMIISYIQLV